jgi:hypothetical protein
MNESSTQKTAEENLPFPVKLYAMLEDASSQGFEDIVSWLPSGKGFKVHDRERFEEHAMAQYFDHTQYESFMRQLNRYDFCYVSQGATKGSYCHQSFIRGKPFHCFHITRKNQKVARTTSSPEVSPRRVLKRNLISPDSIKPTLQIFVQPMAYIPIERECANWYWGCHCLTTECGGRKRELCQNLIKHKLEVPPRGSDAWKAGKKARKRQRNQTYMKRKRDEVTDGV